MSAFKTSLAVLSLLLPASAFAVGVDKAVSDVCKTSKDAAFRAKYCQAAKDNKKGYVANRSTAAIWGGVSVVCLAACGKTYSGAGVVCKASSLGGSAGESMITKNFVESLTGDAENLQELVAKKDAASATTEAGAADGGGKFDGDACTTAGTTALKSYEKIANSKQNERSLQDLREQVLEASLVLFRIRDFFETEREKPP